MYFFCKRRSISKVQLMHPLKLAGRSLSIQNALGIFGPSFPQVGRGTTLGGVFPILLHIMLFVRRSM